MLPGSKVRITRLGAHWGTNCWGVAYQDKLAGKVGVVVRPLTMHEKHNPNRNKVWVAFGSEVDPPGCVVWFGLDPTEELELYEQSPVT